MIETALRGLNSSTHLRENKEGDIYSFVVFLEDFFAQNDW